MVTYKQLLTPNELKTRCPLRTEQKMFIEKSRQEIIQILDGHDSRQLLIVGPCSIHDLEAVKEYAMKLKRLSAEVSDHFLIVMRAYFEKPRTVLGWKGFLYDPLLDNSNDIEKGLLLTRQFLLELVELEIPAAAEFLEPASSSYFDDLIAWGCIGARTCSSQTHRQMASGLPMPIAFKNTTEGNVDAAIHGIISCAQNHGYMGINPEGKISILQTKGNRQGHLVLRGSDSATNYDADSIAEALKILKKYHLPLRLLIDCSHGNSNRSYEQQTLVFQSVIEQILQGNEAIRGVLLESHLNPGNQPMSGQATQLKYAVSLTDPCLDWTTTEELIQWASQKIQEKKFLKRTYEKAIHADQYAFQQTF